MEQVLSSPSIYVPYAHPAARAPPSMMYLLDPPAAWRWSPLRLCSGTAPPSVFNGRGISTGGGRSRKMVRAWKRIALIALHVPSSVQSIIQQILDWWERD
ncbi:hypothetical protein PVAP13_6NG020483 [Panicum virgatum]|uniref:Uncharacterized protein n=1 Tax=Panicum virgatum TaxID=38727 RepID=A0A8T0QTS3_PANVG|nr:hypothetical protein PVAP13_6NG020483 [Panicum virgatum]